MIRLTFELYPKPKSSQIFKNLQGHEFRAVLMNWLRKINPELVSELHRNNTKRPYSIKYSIFKKIPKINFTLISFTPNINKLILQGIILKDNVEIKIKSNVYIISKLHWERIDIKNIFNKSKPINSFLIKFLTPVSFNTKLGDYPVRFPFPSLFFGNLINLWNFIAFDLETIDREKFINWVNSHVYVSNYNMKTIKKDIGKTKPFVGGIGTASFKITKLNKHYYSKTLSTKQKTFKLNNFVLKDYIQKCTCLDYLCKIGELTNVGMNRTAGMGVIKYTPKKYFNELEH